MNNEIEIRKQLVVEIVRLYKEIYGEFPNTHNYNLIPISQLEDIHSDLLSNYDWEAGIESLEEVY